MIKANMIPIVLDNKGHNDRTFDIYSLLLKERIIFLSSAIDDQVASLVVAQLLYLDSQSSKAPINLYIQCPGGSVYAGMAIYDTMNMIASPVSTVAVGFSGSMGTALLASGSKGFRYALPQATIHMHPTTGGGSRGYTEDIRVATREQERLQTQLFYILGKNTGHTWEEIEDFFIRDRFMNALEAQSFGLIDEIMGNTADLIKLNQPHPEVQLYSGQPN
jgi:ATP-dependent Clp protease protease subunit